MTKDVYNQPVFRICGDQGLLMEFGGVISPEIHKVVRAMSIALEEQTIEGTRECVATYRAVAVHYDPLILSCASLQNTLMKIYNTLEDIEIPPPRHIEIPVCYGGELGPDLGFVASSNNLSEKDVIQLHSEQDYLIYMLGFTPGFPFLGGLSKQLHTPRLETPRKRVLAGSVGIANDQTGVYPIDSPGGWQLIGRTPLQLFNPMATEPFLLSSGNILKFKPICEQEFNDILSG
jgi:KipI family sensor histidine kinase inhibitor